MMVFLLTACLLTLALFLPVTLQADGQRNGQTRLRIKVTYAGLYRTWRLRLADTPAGHQLLMQEQQADEQPFDPASLHGSRTEYLLQSLLRADKARGMLLHHTTLHRLDGIVCLHTEDAARTALLTGGLRAAYALLPRAWLAKTRIRIMPVFYQAHTSFRVRCILSCRMGILIITSAMLLAAIVTQRIAQAREAA